MKLIASLLIKIADQWWVITLLGLIITTFFSLLPLAVLPDAPGTDKLHHLISYALLMLPVAIRKPSYYLVIGCLLLCWGGAIELIQPFVNRYGEWMDFLANGAGLCIGLLLGLLLRRFYLIK